MATKCFYDFVSALITSRHEDMIFCNKKLFKNERIELKVHVISSKKCFSFVVKKVSFISYFQKILLQSKPIIRGMSVWKFEYKLLKWHNDRKIDILHFWFWQKKKKKKNKKRYKKFDHTRGFTHSMSSTFSAQFKTHPELQM